MNRSRKGNDEKKVEIKHIVPSIYRKTILAVTMVTIIGADGNIVMPNSYTDKYKNNSGIIEYTDNRDYSEDVESVTTLSTSDNVINSNDSDINNFKLSIYGDGIRQQVIKQVGRKDIFVKSGITFTKMIYNLNNDYSVSNVNKLTSEFGTENNDNGKGGSVMNENDYVDRYLSKLEEDRREQEKRLSENMQLMEQRITEDRRLSEERMEKKFNEAMESFVSTKNEVKNDVKFMRNIQIASLVGIATMVVAVAAIAVSVFLAISSLKPNVSNPTAYSVECHYQVDYLV